MRTVGIIGGLGPKATSELYFKIIEKSKKINKINYPPIVIYSVPLSYKLEREIVNFGRDEAPLFDLLAEGVERLEKSGVDFITMPCNTAHFFIEKLRKIISLPILSIVDETVKEVKNQEFKKVGILATKKR